MPRRRPVWAGGIAILLAGLWPGGFAVAQEPSGRTVGVIPDASALRPEGGRPLAVQQPVYMGDRVQTGPSGEAQIIFVDTTRLVVGPASSLLIDSSLLKNRRTMSSFVVTALRGAFRFISGSSPKPAYAIRTPTATIGVRGTQFDFTVLPNGGTEFVLLHGQAQVCDRGGTCIVARQACSAISVPPNGRIRAVTDRQERNARLRSYFPYVRSEPASLRRDFRADTGTCGNISALGLPADPSDAFRQAPGPVPEAPAPAPTPPAPAPAAPAAPPAQADVAPAAPARPSPPAPAAQPSAPEPPSPSPPEHGGRHGHRGDGDHGRSDHDRENRGDAGRHGHDRGGIGDRGRSDGRSGGWSGGAHGDRVDGRGATDHGGRPDGGDGHDRSGRQDGRDEGRPGYDGGRDPGDRIR